MVVVQRRRDVRVQDRQQRGRVRLGPEDRGLRRRRAGALHPHVHRQRHRTRRDRTQEGLQRMTVAVTSDSNLGAGRPGEPAFDFGHRSRGRALRNQLARVVMWAAFLLALLPLAWILWTVVSRGGELVLHSTWWTNSQRGITSRLTGGGAVHAIQGTLIQGLV